MEENAEWRVEVQDLSTGASFEDSCDVFINAGGYLNNWRWPDAPGLDSFQGKLIHSAKWDDSVQLEGKNVGLIGNGLVLALQIAQ